MYTACFSMNGTRRIKRMLAEYRADAIPIPLSTVSGAIEVDNIRIAEFLEFLRCSRNCWKLGLSTMSGLAPKAVVGLNLWACGVTRSFAVPRCPPRLQHDRDRTD